MNVLDYVSEVGYDFSVWMADVLLAFLLVFQSYLCCLKQEGVVFFYLKAPVTTAADDSLYTVDSRYLELAYLE